MFFLGNASRLVYISVFITFILIAWLAIMMDKRIVKLKKEIDDIKQQLKPHKDRSTSTSNPLQQQSSKD